MPVRTPLREGACIACRQPNTASGAHGYTGTGVPFTDNPAIKDGQWVRFKDWPITSETNPPRKVDHLTANWSVVLQPAPGWRTYARSMDLVPVTDDEMRAFLDAGGVLPCSRGPTA